MNHIFLTVDTECHDIYKVNQYIWGKKGNHEYGIGRILDLGKEYGIPVNFFVDFPEVKRYGEQYLCEILNKIHSFNQPVFLHLHPNFISNDEDRTFLWQYNAEEQRKIIQEGIRIYEKYESFSPKAFRAGRYGIDEVTYNLLDELMPGVCDVSFTGGYGSMCHLPSSYISTVNHYTNFKTLKVMPNCSFVALDMLGIKKTVGVDASEMSLTEFAEFLDEANGRDFVLTMHSWNFIDRLFWSSTHVGSNKTNERLFKGMFKLAKEKGYSFASLVDYDFEKEGNSEDIRYNACHTKPQKIRSLFLNFWRFQNMAKLSKKYLVIYCYFYFFLFLMAIMIIRFI